jgi:hypothetical protein
MPRGWRSALLAATLAVAVPGTPIIRLAAVTCGRCPPACPMHKPGKPRCHEVPRAGHARCNGPAGISAPGCGPRHDPLVRSQTLAVLSPPLVSRPALVAAAVQPSRAHDPGRAPDPPDTPPPVALS